MHLICGIPDPYPHTLGDAARQNIPIGIPLLLRI